MKGSEMTLARYYAKQAVERGLRAQGVKLAHVEAKALRMAAQAYLDAHPELIERAAETVRTNPQLRTLAQRQERQRTGNRR